MNADRELVLEREATVARDVVGVRVRLHDSNEPNPALLGFLEVLLDRKGRIDDDCLVRALVGDEVRGASERLVDELREDHSGTTLALVSAISLEVCGCGDEARTGRCPPSRPEPALPRSPRRLAERTRRAPESP